ncbi:MAG TPA: hypothetical protein VL358_04380 [Caulobacteraceae bacterium]|jgi:hypothetical protein|nr:hypothetical protein [Caulobacteraceae bacterium]
MGSIAYRLDRALEALQGQGLTPVTIILTEADHEALALIPDWPVTTTSGGELRFRSTPVFRARDSEGGSIVGRGVNGATRRVTFADDEPADSAETHTDAHPK